jgi:hypothetical protein
MLTSPDGMYLKWDFEEGFGKDILSEPTSRVASKMSRSVVALASFVVDKPEDSGEHRKGDFTIVSSLYFIYLVTC